MARYEINNAPTPILFGAKGHVERTLQNAKNLIMTAMGEVPYDRLRGFDTTMTDLPMPALNEQLAQEIDRVLAWEPDAELVRAQATPDGEGGVLIRCVIEIRE